MSRELWGKALWGITSQVSIARRASRSKAALLCEIEWGLEIDTDGDGRIDGCNAE